MTRHILLGEADLSEQAGRPLTCQYHLLVRDVPPPGNFESYGVGILLPETGEREEVWDVTVLRERIEALAQLLIRGRVTPCGLRDVVDDWL